MIRQVLLSLDVEEFDIPEEYGQLVGPEDRIRVSSEGLVRVLDLLDRLDISCTCYTTVYFAREQGGLLSRMAARHEIASHGLSHSDFSTGDLLKSRTELEELT